MTKKEKLQYKIYIDTSVREKRQVKLVKVTSDKEKVLGKKTGSIDIISSLTELLNRNKLKLSDIDIFVPELGPGSFTGLKIGVTIANILNWALGKKKLDQLDVPKYGGEPNIDKSVYKKD